MVVHLLLGMVAPLLLTLAAPITVLLRALPVPRARQVSHLLSTRPVRVLTEPVVAALLNVGGMWLLYTTPLYPAMHHHPIVFAVVHLHLFAAGCLFTVAIVSRDPMPHRRSHAHRALVLVLALAAHDILAKYLYAHPPLQVDATSAETGAMIMYYGGDAVELVLIWLLCASWYRATRPRSAPRSSRWPNQPPSPYGPLGSRPAGRRDAVARPRLPG
jgi:putative membrane protein